MKRFTHLFFILVLLSLLFSALGMTPAKAAAPAWVDISSRQAALDFYLNEYLASENVPSNWSGDVANCNAGTTSAEFKAAVLRRVNYFRAMAGMPNVSLNDTYNAKAQAAALMMSANGTLNHFPPPTWTCYTADGAEAAGKSNLSIGNYGPSATFSQMRDHGDSNYFVGHRRSILYPPMQQTGTGDIPPTGGYQAANALWVIGSTGPRPATREAYVAWPPPGYVPYQVVYARWSFSYPNADFTAATVAMSSNGTNVPLTQENVLNGYGDNTLVWRPYNYDSYTAWPAPTSDTTYTVTVSNVLIGGSPQTFTYDVIVFDPTPVTNNEIENAISITTMPYTNTQSVASATTAADDPVLACVGGQRYRTVWYKFTPAASGTLDVDTFGSNYDTALAVWTGTRGNLTNIGCNDDAGSESQSQLTLPNLTAGTTYYIEVVSYFASPAGQNLQLNAAFTGTSPNQTLTVSKAGSGTGTVTSSPAGINCGATCSYAFAYNTTVTLTATPTAGHAFAGWSGSGCSGTGTCTITMTEARSVTATFNAPTGVPNDDFNNAIVFTTPYSNTQSVEGATTDTDDPAFTCVTGQGYLTVWYKFTPAASGTLDVDTIGSNYDTILAAWTGTRGNLTSIGCNDDASGSQSKLTLSNLAAGTTYYIEVASFEASPANPSLHLNATFTNAPEIPATWVGGVAIQSDQSIVAVARPHLGSQIASYIGSGEGSIIQYVPMLFKDAFGGSYKSALYIQNLGSASANLTIEFINEAGAVVHTISEPLAAKASKGYWLSGIAGIPAGFAGGAKVTADQRILAVGRPHIGAEVMSYNGMSSGSTAAWLPMFFKNGFGNYNTALYVQNITNSSANLTIEYLNLDGTVACTKADTVAANASKGYWSLAVTCDTGSLPAGFVGGVKVTSTENILAVGRAHLGTQITTYNGFDGGAGSAYVPMLFRKAYGGTYNAALYLQNVSGSSADVTIEYVNDAGAVAATQNVTLAAGAIGSIWLPGVAGLPDGFVGGARITATQDVIAVGRPHLNSEITAYNGASGGSLNAYLPMLFKNAFGNYQSAFYIQNVTGNAATVNISFYDDASTLSCIKSITLAANATQGFWMPTVTCAP